MDKVEATKQVMEMELEEFEAMRKVCEKRNINLHDFLMFQIERHLFNIKYNMELGND